jgi:hypothetical protein
MIILFRWMKEKGSEEEPGLASVFRALVSSSAQQAAALLRFVHIA